MAVRCTNIQIQGWASILTGVQKYLITAYLDAFYQNSIGEISYVFREAPLKIFSAHLENDMKENLKYLKKFSIKLLQP